MAVTIRRYTFEEWVDSPANTPRGELVRGNPVDHVTTSPDHGDVATVVFAWLYRAVEAGYGYLYTDSTAVLLDPAGRRENARGPDFSFVRADREHVITDRAIEGTPDLIVEILSESNRADDLPGGDKWRDYEQYGVPRYWIIDPATRSVAQYVWRAGRYEGPLLARGNASLHCDLFPELALPVDRLFRRVRIPERPLNGEGFFRLSNG